MRVGVKLLLVGLAVAAAGVLIGFYASNLTTLAGSPAYSVPVQEVSGHKVVNLTLQTVAAVGPELSQNPDWVSYLIRNAQGEWKRETVWDLPADAAVHVTIYNFDSATGLRNPYYGRPQGMVGNRVLIDGKPVDAVDPNEASHTFAVPQLGIILAIPGVADDAKNPCGYAPCLLSNAHRTVQFTFRTPAKSGTFRWQCFVPCAAGWIDGFGGPMQTIGYMDGYLNVKA
jgi:hypothetical protein